MSFSPRHQLVELTLPSHTQKLHKTVAKHRRREINHNDGATLRISLTDLKTSKANQTCRMISNQTDQSAQLTADRINIIKKLEWEEPRVNVTPRGLCRSGLIDVKY